MEAVLGNRAEGVAQLRLAERLAADNEYLNASIAYHYRIVGLHDEAASIARAWAEERPEGRPQGAGTVLYYLVFDEEDQALDALVQLVETATLINTPVSFVMYNAFDDPILEKPEFQELRAELRAKFGRN